MTDFAIRAHSLSKKYEITARAGSHFALTSATLRDAIMQRFRRRRPEENEAKEHWALRDMSFEIAAGECVGIVGRNGAGKSTLLKVLSRITDPTDGYVEIHGRVASLLEVGTGFHAELTGRENVLLNGAILGMRRAEILRKFDEIVAFSEVEKFIDTPVKHYSTGMYLRLAFAVAAHLDSEVLLVDEVLAVGDQAFQRRCLNKMGDVARSGRTVLLVSHNMAAIESLCERGILISDGRIEMSGSAADVVRRYSAVAGERAREDLSARTDRRGDGTLRFTSIGVHVDGTDNVVLHSGCRATFEIGYSATASNTGRIAMSILDQYDRMLFACDSEHVGDPLTVGSSGTIRCTIPELPLSPGSYRITLWATNGGNVADHVQHAAEFEVVTADFFGTGRLPSNPKYGPFLVRHQWAST